ncbi:MAG: glycoside hydrolase family 2 [Clostridiales bacterium]|nr:glycoside hydrolase family 2 [Clostridiales bacterium]
MLLPIRPEFPNPQMERSTWKNLNGQWQFRLFPAGEESGEAAFAQARGDYDRTITVPFSWAAPLSGVADDRPGVGWYRRAVEFDGSGRVFLCFGAVDYRCDAYVNGVCVGSHEGGYTAFSFDVTGQWLGGENLIEVRAEDFRRPHQTYGKQGYGEIQGIWQTVWLERRPATHIRSMRITAGISGEVALVAKVFAAQPGEAALSAAFDGGRLEARVNLAAGEQAVKLSFAVASPRLWSPDAPNLYEGSVALSSEFGVDQVSTYFGIREIGTAAFGDRGYPWVTLNGKPIYLNGTLDQAFNPKGFFTYPTDEDMRMEAWRLKRLGLNMVRIHIKPEEPRKLYWMDRLGVLVMQDMPCFWGEPDERARAAYESEWPDAIERDFNHPSIFSWVMFNESWGLLTSVDGEKQYLPDTQEWVRDVYRRAKAYDDTRLIEDNSPCRYDHVETDINSWHFYLNGYEQVRDHVREVASGTYLGSRFNYIGENLQSGSPLINSECGLVWGVDGSAGDSDLGWHYRYMLNEFRLCDKIGGFVFTEFHDVVNEFNGYYRLDDRDKDFGYRDYCRGMTIRDLHAVDFVAIDAPPCQIVEPGETVNVPLVLSSFATERRDQGATIRWELWHEGPDGRQVDECGSLTVGLHGHGATPLGSILPRMPRENALAVLSVYLVDAAGNVVSRNFTTFDVRAAWPEGTLAVPVASGKGSGFTIKWQALGGQKACFGGAGEVTFEVDLTPLANRPVYGLEVCFEAGAKRVLTKDRGKQGAPQADPDFMHGYRVDRGQFDNSYWMTDEDRVRSEVELKVDGETIDCFSLPNDPADARGALSWAAQPDPRKLDEAGSYGYLCRTEIPSRLVPGLIERGRVALTLKVPGDGGLALYGRGAGRYPIDLMVRAW